MEPFAQPSPTSRKTWIIVAVVVGIVLTSLPFLPKILRNLKSDVLGEPVITVDQGRISNLNHGNKSFDVTFEKAGPATIEVKSGEFKGLLQVTVEEPSPVVTTAPLGNFSSAPEEPAQISPPAEKTKQPETTPKLPEPPAIPKTDLKKDEGTLKASAETKNPYSDVAKKTKYANSIQKVFERSLMTGTPQDDGKLFFEPNQRIDRAQFVTILMRLKTLHNFKTKKKNAKCNFSDFEPEKWYIEPITKACKEGVAEGYSDGTFKPTHFVNYAEAIALVVRTVARFDTKVAEELKRQESLRKPGQGQWYDASIDTALAMNILTQEAWNEMNRRNPWTGAPRAWIADLIAHIPEL